MIKVDTRYEGRKVVAFSQARYILKNADDIHGYLTAVWKEHQRFFQVTDHQFQYFPITSFIYKLYKFLISALNALSLTSIMMLIISFRVNGLPDLRADTPTRPSPTYCVVLTQRKISVRSPRQVFYRPFSAVHGIMPVWHPDYWRVDILKRRDQTNG